MIALKFRAQAPPLETSPARRAIGDNVLYHSLGRWQVDTAFELLPPRDRSKPKGFGRSDRVEAAGCCSPNSDRGHVGNGRAQFFLDLNTLSGSATKGCAMVEQHASRSGGFLTAAAMASAAVGEAQRPVTPGCTQVALWVRPLWEGTLVLCQT